MVMADDSQARGPWIKYGYSILAGCYDFIANMICLTINRKADSRTLKKACDSINKSYVSGFSDIIPQPISFFIASPFCDHYIVFPSLQSISQSGF